MEKMQVAKKILCIVGPTATGKTNLAIKLNQTLGGVLISADSRQVYCEMDVVTGKDHPPVTKLVGLDIVKPNQECSVAVWRRAIETHLQRSHLPIIVGGTGFYIKSVIEDIPTLSIPPNQALRQQLEQQSVITLKSRLKLLNPVRFARLNHSDSENPRRLIRAIEIEIFSLRNKTIVSTTPKSTKALMIGLHYSDSIKYRDLIFKRVLARLKNGALQETKDLVAKYGENLFSLSAIGYRSLIAYLADQLSQEEMISNWVANEYSYAKRQITWFKKVPFIKWYDAEDPLLFNKVSRRIAKFTYSCYDNKRNI